MLNYSHYIAGILLNMTLNYSHYIAGILLNMTNYSHYIAGISLYVTFNYSQPTNKFDYDLWRQSEIKLNSYWTEFNGTDAAGIFALILTTPKL